MMLGVVSHAAGSSYVEIRNTKVFCAVHGPNPLPPFATYSDTGHLVCEIRFAPFSRVERQRPGRATDEERELSAVLAGSLGSSLILDRFPKSQLDVSVVVMEEGGSALDAAIIAASLALADAGVPQRDLVSARSACLMHGSIVLDPTPDQVDASDSRVVVAYMPSLGKISQLVQSGELGLEDAGNALEVCRQGCEEVHKQMTARLEESVKKAIKKARK